MTYHSWIKTNHQTTIALATCVSLVLLLLSTAVALQPPRPGEIEELKRRGEYAARLAHAEALGNHKVDPYLIERLRVKAQRAALEAKGLSKEDAAKSVPLPAPPPDWQGGLPASGTVNVLAVLIDFPDWPHGISQATIQNALFGPGDPSDYPRESLSNYYARASYDTLHITGNVLDWYRTAYDRSTIMTNDAGRETLLKEVLNYWDGQGHDFSQYDNDGNGVIDYFIIIWAGPDTGWSSFWWGYQTSFGDGGYTLDGKTLRKYSWQWEARPVGSAYDQIVVLHETGHALGLPDYYDYDDTVGPKGGLGGLDMMDGNWGDHNSFSKWLLEWISPTIVGTGGGVKTLRASGAWKDAIAIWPGHSGSEFSEFFMVQNRHRVGNDANFPNDGLLIWHLDAQLDGGDYKFNNSYTSHKLIRLMEADGLEQIETNGPAGASDYYVQGLKFTPYTFPSSAAYDGSDTCIRVGNISASGTNMTAGFTVDCLVPELTIPSDVYVGDTCVGGTNFATLYVCNTGTTNLIVGPITSSNSRFRVVPPSSGFPVVISPDFCFPFVVEFAPLALGQQSTTFTVPSNDPITPTNTVEGFGNGVGPSISAAVANSGNFGDVCLGSFKDLDLTINNRGGCDLWISNITSSSSQFVGPGVVTYPLVVHPGDSIALPIRFEPTSPGPKSGTIAIASNDRQVPSRIVLVSGTAPTGDIRITGSTDFGDVCAGTLAEKVVSICNVGLCNLNVFSVTVNCPDFTIVNNPFPAAISPDFCVPIAVRFTPTSCGPKTCTLTIISDDPDSPTNTLTLTANTPCPDIDVPPDLAFLPEVIQSVGTCNTHQPFPISNKGQCLLTITDISIGGVNASDYSISGLPSFPILLEPGHIAGEGDLEIVFAPTVVDRDREATITVTYVIDPILGTTAQVTRQLCGEGVRTGARVLVMQGGIPVAKVEKIQLQRINANRNRNRLDSLDNSLNLALTTVVPALPCPPFQYHREYGTVSNPVQLLPGAYQVTATAIINGKRKTKVVGFDLQTCDFNPTVVVDF